MTDDAAEKVALVLITMALYVLAVVTIVIVLEVVRLTTRLMPRRPGIVLAAAVVFIIGAFISLVLQNPVPVAATFLVSAIGLEAADLSIGPYTNADGLLAPWFGRTSS